MRPIAGGVCAICGERLFSSYAWSVPESQPRCGLCRRIEPTFARAVAYGSYEGGLRELIHLLKLLPVQTESTAFTLPYAGQWLVTCFWGTAAADIAANPTVTPGSNVTLLSLIADHGSISVANHVSTSAFLSFVCSVSASAAAASNQIAIGGLTSMTAATCDIFVQQTSGALTDIVETKKHASLLDELVNQVCIRMKGEVPDSRPLFENRPPNTPLHFSEREMTDVSLLETLKGISARLGAR